jgi:Chaperone of endosialidase
VTPAPSPHEGRTAPARPATARVRRLRGVTWQWLDDAPEEARRQPGMGVIAQDVQAEFPDLIEITPEGLLKVDYGGLVFPVLDAVGELSAGVRAMEERMATNEGQGGAVGDETIEQVERIAEATVDTPAHEIDADALAKVFPELVTVDDNGEREIAWHSLVGLLIEAVRELDTRLTAVEEAAKRRSQPGA